ncbi:methyltransferase domain-containing protein [Streptomyces herbicida]|uniref:hypothetical protein n=1 Tax=Streptomyces herbicida TaxID=3065675 RepID=UPI00292EC710|nr:hypothetical protein [Streptomyces sp. NEAU-HV9]
MLRRLLPAAPAHVLDVGGGSGVHAQWLVRDGHTVELLDPVPLLARTDVVSEHGRRPSPREDCRDLAGRPRPP